MLLPVVPVTVRCVLLLAFIGLTGCGNLRHNPCACFDDEVVECDSRSIQDCELA